MDNQNCRTPESVLAVKKLYRCVMHPSYWLIIGLYFCTKFFDHLFCSELWKDPSSFNPDRFLSADGTELNKMEGEKVMVFGMGKRRCIGESIARNEVYLFLAILSQNLRFQAVPGQPLDMTPEYGLTMKHKRCQLRATIRARNEE